MDVDDVSDAPIVSQWINEALISESTPKRLEYFHKLQEVLLRKSPSLLPEYLPHILNFATDRNADIKKTLIGFIEELCRIYETFLPSVMIHLHMLLCDESTAVQKRVVQAMISIYRKTLSWLCQASVVTDEMEKAWKQLSAIKLEIANMIDSDNDGIRTSTVKFLECVILLQTYPDQAEGGHRENDFSLDDVPLTLKIARRRKLEEEANVLFELLLKFHGSSHVSSANLLTCLGVIANIAKIRAEFMSRVINAIESLTFNLPPTLTTTQVNSVRKKLKTELMGLIKHPAAYDYVDRLTPLLMDLGYSQSEVMKMVPKAEERRRYCKRTLSMESMQIYKKPRLELDYDNDSDTELESPTALLIQAAQKTNAANAERQIRDLMSTERIADLVMESMIALPEQMPSAFARDYQQLLNMAAVGKLDGTVKLIRQLLDEHKLTEKLLRHAKDMRNGQSIDLDLDDEDIKPNLGLDELTESAAIALVKKKTPKIKTIKLPDVTRPANKESKENWLLGSVNRVLRARGCIGKSTTTLYEKVITTMGASFSPSVRHTVLQHLLTDVRSSINIVLAWLFDEYSILSGFSRVPALRRDPNKLDQTYNILLCAFMANCASDPVTFGRIVLEAPLITDEAMERVHELCRDSKRSAWALSLLRDLIHLKPPKQIVYLQVLLNYTTFEDEAIRDIAVQHVLNLYQEHSELKSNIESFSVKQLDHLASAHPPSDALSGPHQGRIKSESWSEELVRACMTPFVNVLPLNNVLIHDMGRVYVQTGADNKRVMLRLVETPARTMGVDSKHLLQLVEKCPEGAETLVTRLVRLVTDKCAPSAELVERVRHLYETRVTDVRFIIPVLGGLPKTELLAALPKIIRLNPVVVREAFNRLLSTQHGSAALTPTELLVALHVMETNQADIKTVMKATSICLQDKQVFTQEVLAVVLQQLMDQSSLPTLLMRTVIQALGNYPRLSGFVMNILQRLILKQVWKHKVVWEGFIKCCQRTKPQSFAVLMQLPTPQLQDALSMCPELWDPLREHLLSYTESQRSHIPSAVQEILLGQTPTMVPPVMGLTPPVGVVPPPSDSLIGKVQPLPPGME